MADLISRSAALEVLEKHGNNDLACYSEYEEFKTDINSIPAIDAVPVVHARWIYSGHVDADGNRHANCSHCGAGEEHKEEWTHKVPYCWSCGARMDACDIV